MKKILKSEKGQHLVEFALILPLLLLMLLGIIEFGGAVFSYNTIANAAREVARYGVIHPNQSEINTYINDNLGRWTQGIHEDEMNVISTVRQTNILGTVNVTVTYQYKLISGPLIQAIGGEPILELRTTSTMNTETFPD
jgi:Flp pilus assembly protein TadG